MLAMSSGGDNLPPNISGRAERRRKPRFAMQCSILLRSECASEQWIPGETANVSAAGAYFASNAELPQGEPVEYVLTFPPELTHASAPWGVRFFGSVVRIEPDSAVRGMHGIAVYTTKHRYLSREESDRFCSLDETRTPASAGV